MKTDYLREFPTLFKNNFIFNREFSHYKGRYAFSAFVLFKITHAALQVGSTDMEEVKVHIDVDLDKYSFLSVSSLMNAQMSPQRHRHKQTQPLCK